jgi:hypothetical protein
MVATGWPQLWCLVDGSILVLFFGRRSVIIGPLLEEPMLTSGSAVTGSEV